VLLVAVIAVGYRAPQEATASTAVATANVAETTDAPAVNDVLATDIAASVAQAADLAVAPNVAELAVSTRVQSEYQSTSDTSTISKPAIVQVSSAGRNITTYAVQPGDTVTSVAAKYGISQDTIKWANNLTGDALAANSNLEILPRDGIAYTVKDGDTIEKIADRYKADPSVITTYNDLEINGIATGLKIIIPNGNLPETERPGYVAPRAAVATGGTYITGYSSGFSGGKTWFIKRGTPNNGRYAFGNCTAYAFDRRLELGRPIGAMWGNAGAWATNARVAGYQVDRTPEAGAVIQDAGHVAIVEVILPNGDLQLSEMNASVSGGGFNIVSGRILPASQVGQYYYIH
jgi:surface antigen